MPNVLVFAPRRLGSNLIFASGASAVDALANGGVGAGAGSGSGGDAVGVTNAVANGGIGSGAGSGTGGSASNQSDADKITLILKILGNRQELDAAAGKFRLYDDDSITVLYEVNAWEDAAGTVPYRGQGLQRIDRLA